MLQAIQLLLDRVKAKDVVVVRDDSDDSKITATVYGMQYTFELHGNRVEVSRGDLRSYFMLAEVQMLDHVCMPYVTYAGTQDVEYIFPEQKATDVAMRLHLIMAGDICLSTEAVIYVAAGTQRSTNYIKAR